MGQGYGLKIIKEIKRKSRLKSNHSGIVRRSEQHYRSALPEYSLCGYEGGIMAVNKQSSDPSESKLEAPKSESVDIAKVKSSLGKTTIINGRKIKQLSKAINKIDQWVLDPCRQKDSSRTQARIRAKLKIRKALQEELSALKESIEAELAAKRKLAMKKRLNREALYYKLNRPKKITPSDELLWRTTQIIKEMEPIVKRLAFELFNIDADSFYGIQGLKTAIYRVHFSLGGNRISEDKNLSKRRQTLLCALTALRAATESKKYILVNHDLAWYFLATAERNFGVAKALSWNGLDILITSSQRKGGKGRHQNSIEGQSLALIKDEWLKIPEKNRIDKKFNKSEWARSQIPVMKGDITERAVLSNIRKWNQEIASQ